MYIYIYEFLCLKHRLTKQTPVDRAMFVYKGVRKSFLQYRINVN